MDRHTCLARPFSAVLLLGRLEGWFALPFLKQGTERFAVSYSSEEDLLMDTIRFNYLITSLLLTPFVAFAAYIAWLVVPVVVREVVPEVVRAVTNI